MASESAPLRHGNVVTQLVLGGGQVPSPRSIIVISSMLFSLSTSALQAVEMGHPKGVFLLFNRNVLVREVLCVKMIHPTI